MSLLNLPEELLENLYILLEFDDWLNLVFVCAQLNRIGQSDKIWKSYCIDKHIEFKSNDVQTWKEQYMESCKYITLEFEKNFVGFHFVQKKSIKLKVMKKIPFYEISEGLCRHFKVCGHNNRLECDETCHSWPTYLMCRKGAIVNRARSPMDVGLVDHDKISIVNSLLLE